MTIEVKVPVLPESVADATILTWNKQEGDVVERDDVLAELETDKVVLEVPATESGVLGKILKQEGETVVANELLAVIEEGAGAVPAATEAVASEVAGDANAASSPAVRRLLSEHDLDAASVKGTGKGGRILKEDVLAAAKTSAAPAQPAPVAAAAPVAKAAPAPVAPVVELNDSDRVEKRVPMTRLRAKIAERLVDAQHTTAMLTTFNEVNMKPIMDLRKKYQERFVKTHDVKLGFMSFFVKAVTEALKKFPAVNASIDGSDIVYHGYFDIGVAVSSPRGLVVPVVRNTDQMGLADTEKKIIDYGQRATKGAIALDEMQGGTFTITNGGTFGSMMSTPILNPPQSGILGMHAIKERAMVVDGQVVVLPMMYLALSYDHRIIDGKEAVQFLVTVKDLLEEPARLLLDL
ncbi:2-oxoglutarate dehydrogenase complex dihydrolipoyllysine-residue succinyltransferase [Pelagibaculum spongiae]|uniref:Dihydrolipoyllysine-residue succinyltransferase component of 2-oxoglutarate dehydrogenase complex n=1 Tax=Pelagibaculum spongiae TaxID=2080658 RepID=A0A2V1H2R5_9GAMM|nr:2-oxoglutarate dehydrogenase complex dihydrolipoyllysine-residue succinyltransferase [Pelagibaculum spongiae]PVZ69587.1 dihydrolipoamide succinyltransferase [Pelagibaculum spongiae]